MEKQRILLEEIKTFTKNVSIRYVPKLISTKDTLLRLFWIICFLVSLGLLVWQLYLIFERYFSYPKTTQYGEDPSSKITFPEITICNSDPLAEVTNPPFTYQTVLDEVLRLNKSKEEYKKLLNVSNQLLDDFFSFIGSQDVYISSLDINVNADDRCPRLVVDCRLFDQFMAPLDYNCSEYFRAYWSAQYYRCVKVRVPDNLLIGGISLILYLRNSEPTNLPFQLMLANNKGVGARITLHNPGEIPDYACGMTLGPSTDNTVILTQTTKKRLSTPYSSMPCTEQPTLPFANNDRYSSKMCWDACLQDKIIGRCGCFSHLIAITDKMMDEGRVCGNLTCSSKYEHPSICSQRGIDQLMCSIRVFNSANGSPSSCPMCLEPCSENLYDFSVYSNPWPHPSYHCDIHSSWSNSSDKNTFMQVNLIFKTMTPFVMEDKPAFSVDSMLSQFGGCLGLWMGIGLTTLVEVLEILYIYILRALGDVT